MKVLVTGGAGFIGSALVQRLVGAGNRVLNFDFLTYAGNSANLSEIAGFSNHTFMKGDVADPAAVAAAFREIRPNLVFHLAAETHVDRSIDDPAVFIHSNIAGTFTVLNAALAYLRAGECPGEFRFIYVSTDEVFGSLGPSGVFTEDSPLAPNSPYSASKASGEVLTRAWHRTYGVPSIIAACSNNYGPRQNQEKLIPTIIANSLLGRPIPIYGNGMHVRDWIYVEDHVSALLAVAEHGRIGEKYNIGSSAEIANIDLARLICAALDNRRPRPDGRSFQEQLTFVAERPGHDTRYAMDSSKVRRETGWGPSETFASGIAQTIEWYCANETRWRASAEAGNRLGLSGGKVA